MSGILVLILALVLMGLALLLVRRGVGTLIDAIFRPRPTFAFQFPSDRPPEDAIADAALALVPELGTLGYGIETHSGATLVFERSVTPRPVYAIPLILAALAFVGGVVSSSSNAPQHGGIAAAILLSVAILMSLTVKVRERITFSARATGSQTMVAVTGSTPPAVRDDLVARFTDGSQGHRGQ